jgi:hypothetical protein
VRALAAAGRSGKLVQLRYRPIVDGLGVRAVVIVRSPHGATVFRTTTGMITVHADQTYSVPWLPAKALRGRFGYCVRTVTAGGASSPVSCSTVLLHR